MERAPHRDNWRRGRLLAPTLSLFFIFQLTCVDAYFIVDLKVVSFENPSNTDASGVCCTATEAVDACSTPCNVSKYDICIRPNGSSLPENQCPIFNIKTTSGGTFHVPKPWPGAVQILISPLEGMAYNPVELFEIEYEATPAQPGITATADSLSATGNKTDSVLNLTLSVQCQAGFIGPRCDCQDRNDSSGHFTCTLMGGIECLEGYQDPTTNCTACSPAPGCSVEGGFCEAPGDCICREGFSGDNCSLTVSTSVLDTPVTSLVHGSVLSPVTVQTLSLISSLPPVAPSSVEPAIMSSSIGPPEMMSSMEPSVMVLSSSAQPSPFLDISSAAVPLTTVPASSPSLSVSSPVPSSLVQSTQGPSLTTSTPTEVSTVVTTSSAQPSSSDLPMISSSNISPSITLTTTIEPQTTTVQDPQTTTVQEPRTTTVQMTTFQEPQTTTVQEPQTTTVQEPQITTLEEPQTTTVQEPQTTGPRQSTVLVSETQATAVTPPPILTTRDPTTPTQPTTDPPAPTPTQPTTDPPAPSSGNLAVIAGSVGVIAGVVVLIVLVIPCVYLIVRRKRKNERKRAAVFLDEVYNAPVTFVNPDHVTISPRSPELYVPGDGQQQDRGSSLDVSHKPTFPGVSYREHVPYAENGPSSDHAESPEEPRLQQVEDAGVTIIANPHSLSSHSPQSPQMSTPPTVTTSPISQRRSGLEFEYKDDPVGDTAYLSTKYSTEQPLYSRPQSGPDHSGTVGTGGSGEVGHMPPPLPPRVLLKPSPTPRTRGSGRDPSPRRTAEQRARSGRAGRKGRERKESEREEEDEEEDGMKKRVSEYLQAAQEEGEKRQSFMRDINFFTDINLDMTTQTAL